MSVVVVVVLVGFVLPRFETFFEDLDAELPLPTRMLLGVSDFLTDNWYLIVGGVLVARRARPRGRPAHRARPSTSGTACCCRLPVLGDLMQHVVLERFCRILSVDDVGGRAAARGAARHHRRHEQRTSTRRASPRRARR